PTLRKLLRLRLQRIEGVEVVAEAGDGRMAVELCETLQPHLVLLDLSMPELDGLQAAGQIRDRAPGTDIFVFSGYPAAAMRDRALRAGASAYFEKSSSLEGIFDA